MLETAPKASHPATREIRTLAKIPLFGALAPDEVHALDGRCFWKRVGGGEWVIDYQADGADVWADSEVYAHGVTVGAPPDEFNQSGQNWASRPWRPDKLAETGYSSYRRILAGTFRHAHGLRIDHVMGLFRLWWIPEGKSADQGTYVSYDHDAMLGVLTLEAHRERARLTPRGASAAARPDP